jgi:glutamate dehydrogenase
MIISDSRKESLVRAVAAEARRSRGGPKIDLFVRRFFHSAPMDELVGRPVPSLAAEARSALANAAKRKKGQLKVHVFNPDAKKDGWTSSSTIVEIANDDMPFLVDSASAAMNRLGAPVLAIMHPVVYAKRNANGVLTDISETSGAGLLSESIMTLEIARQDDPRKLKEIEAELGRVFADVRAAVQDWQPMRALVQSALDDLKRRPVKGSTNDIIEAQAFLQWAQNNHFTFLGYREYEFTNRATRAKVDAKSGRGILRDPKRTVFRDLRAMADGPSELQGFMKRTEPVIISKADVKSTVHRAVTLDVIGVKKYDQAGRVVGERLIVGLFTSTAYSTSPRVIPILRKKIETALKMAGYPANSHDGKALSHVLETFPRDELFQIHDADLLAISQGILQAQERQKVALFARLDDFQRYISFLVFVPRDRYSHDFRQHVQAILERAYGGEMVGYNTEYGETPLVRVHMTVQLAKRGKPEVNLKAVETEIASAARSWDDALRQAFAGKDTSLLTTWSEAFPASYTETTPPERAIADIEKLEEVVKTGRLTMDLYRPAGAQPNQLRFKVFNPHIPLPLSDVLPMLEHMGLKVLDEVPHEIHPANDAVRLVMVHDFGLVTRNGASVDLDAIRENFHDAFGRAWAGELESDALNALVLSGGLPAPEITVLRHFTKYLRQIKAPFSQDYMATALNNNPKIAAALAKMFVAKFDPKSKERDKEAENYRKAILTLLDAVTSADEDRVLRRFLNVVESALRTNYFQTAADGRPKPYLSVKFDSTKIDEMPLPRPLREIFVYSPRVEAIHLRGGLVARGGIRWSDRPEDFRTEILGLMKAQMVKNAVIVPVGSKGGFFVKRSPTEGGRDAVMAEGVACYRTFMSGLLDITDNLKAGKVIPPKDTVRLDGDDPYLVVAADKGTATFSDIANGIATDYGFWLGDAFASGGSVGYDHKKMGITARGAWECVKRHFREIGKDIQNEDFICVGVGDMSGDVFGNGMMLSKHTKLVGAFNHLHIFVDPNPDPAKSWAERVRLFNLPRSSWTDYDARVLSKGGAVYDRKAKSISLSPEAKARFGVTKPSLTPNELIKVLLLHDAELLFFGGIGTYIKASHETNADADDRSNDGVRINAKDLRAKVVGEGANLGVTQRGRIEYALGGGAINADSIDNSAGVDTSDHEVNIKILLDAVVAKKKLTYKERNTLLAKMTDDLAELVLRDNYLQSQAISLTRAHSLEVLDLQQRFVRLLEKAGRLDRVVEFLPDDETWAERETAKVGLTRPEVAVTMPYAKMWLYDHLLESSLPDEKLLEGDLIGYFPPQLRDKYKKEILAHQLRREIVATVVTNSTINRVGGTFAIDMMEKTGANAVDITRAYIATRDAYQLRNVWGEIEALDAKVHADAQIKLFFDVQQLIERSTLWLLRNLPSPIDITKATAEFQGGIAQLAANIEKIAPKEVTERVEFRIKRYTEAGVPAALARKIAYLILLVSALDIVRAAQVSRRSLIEIARLYFQVGETFGLGWLRYSAERLPADSHWQKLAAAAVIEELYQHQKNLTLRILGSSRNGMALDAWVKANGGAMEQMKQMLAELEAANPVDLSMLAVASRQLSALAAGG